MIKVTNSALNKKKVITNFTDVNVWEDEYNKQKKKGSRRVCFNLLCFKSQITANQEKW